MDINDEKLLIKIENQWESSSVIYYHQLCRVNYTNSVNSHITITEGKKTECHQARDFHKTIFQEICRFVTDNIIKRKQCYYLSFLKTSYIDNAKKIINDPSINVKPHNLANRLLEKFHKKINIVGTHEKRKC